MRIASMVRKKCKHLISTYLLLGTIGMTPLCTYYTCQWCGSGTHEMYTTPFSLPLAPVYVQGTQCRQTDGESNAEGCWQNFSEKELCHGSLYYESESTSFVWYIHWCNLLVLPTQPCLFVPTMAYITENTYVVNEIYWLHYGASHKFFSCCRHIFVCLY